MPEDVTESGVSHHMVVGVDVSIAVKDAGSDMTPVLGKAKMLF